MGAIRYGTLLEASPAVMRRIRRTVMTMGVLVVALLPVTAAVSTDAATPDEIPVAITQPIGHLASAFGTSGPVLPETAMMMIAGTGLLGLGTIVRRSTSAMKVSGIRNQVSGLG
jgi:hypothetical protein